MDHIIASNAWKSINEMLVQNRCWICQNVFQKGKKKKVFMISQIIQVFKEIQASPEGPDDDRVKILTAFMTEAPYVTLCWQSFQFLKGDEKKLADALQKADVQVWVSGLACARNHLCSAIYNSLFSDGGREAQMASIQALKGSFTRSTFCPPGCDCGWQFITESRIELLAPGAGDTPTAASQPAVMSFPAATMTASEGKEGQQEVTEAGVAQAEERVGMEEQREVRGTEKEDAATAASETLSVQR
jgi:hypothetical protein